MAIITISRGSFSGGQTLAECVAEKLGYRCISSEALVEATSEYNLSLEGLTRALEDKPGMLEHLTSNRGRYLACLRAILIREGRNEKLVYHGYAGHLLLEDVPHIIRARVIANMDFRIKALTDHHNVSREEAIQFIEKIDRERAEWTRSLHVDWNDPSLYDIVLHIDKMSLSSACEIVCHLANDKTYEATADSQRMLDDLVLSSHIEALIISNKNISSKVKIEANEGVITIKGTANSSLDADRVQMMVHETPGVKSIRSQMRVKFSGVTTKGLDHKR